jgi:hypothetical protein
MKACEQRVCAFVVPLSIFLEFYPSHRITLQRGWLLDPSTKKVEPTLGFGHLPSRAFRGKS